ncbi:MAG: IclR family transcriptional regulator [Anaeromicrobium sp.]|jgi:DNA-binding IclR family transcriptional regulator|uniref:IclR family transcriptional regulator n=1 Tax=Anaeromicrobium sp. TaxID=1929132 RepID=UPI0025F806AC|nr:IclR family transcriptional regulator [Anaeromicrobium sp.]MCT4593418.1 IclR family transcriptional regulator [Anaeromicrobium sp.]
MIINSVDRALDIIILLYEEEKEMGVSDIADRLNTYKSTIHRTLVTLEGKGFVKKNPDTEKYWLGMKLHAIGMLINNNLPIKKIIKPYCDELHRKFGEVVNASVLDKSDKDHLKGHIIYKAYDSTQLLIVNPPEGAGSPCYGSSVGKCLLAFNHIDFEKYKDVKLMKYTDKTIDNWDELIDKLKEIREKGYAIDDEELEVGLTCIGAPVLDKNNRAIAAISLSGPTQRMRAGDFEEKIRAVVETAQEISKQFR